VIDTYNIGDELEGTVTKVVTFGAFVEILDGVEGLVHISELSQQHVENPREIIQPGDDVRVKILEIDSERRRLSLSVKRVEDQILPVRPIEPPTGDLDDVPELGLSEDVFGGPAAAVEPVAAEAETAAEPEAEAETAAEAATAVEPEAEAETAAEPEAEAETAAEPEAEAETAVEPEAEAETAAEPEAEAETAVEPEAEAPTAAETAAEPEPDTAAEPEAEADADGAAAGVSTSGPGEPAA
jgi:small subunit ribosomal protein S1